ncbi:MAG TPA: SAM-dependent chlorinase/fluorinase [Acidimicrobiales bacterium]|nr:SAM-dependent chlorinase/fluorinase [Acidimicrobiales bacterium]
MTRRHETVSFLSDFGLEDEFTGVVRSVIRSVAPHVTVIDITHGVPAHDVRAGSLALVRSVQYLAPGVVLAVVDPGVGTDRRAVAVEVGTEGEAVFVGPDNGLLAGAVAMVGGATRAVELTETRFHLPAPGATFAGRDVFAPVVGHLCNGVDLSEMGLPIDPITLRPGLLPLSRNEEGKLVSEVLWVDHFGNAQLNVDPGDIAAMGDRISLKWGIGQVRTGRLADNYAELKAGEVGLVVDSYGLVSVALDRRSAAEELKLRPGDAVSLEAAS